MKIAKLLAGGVVVGVTVLSCKKEELNINNQLNDADNNFIKRATIGNYFEIETSKIAVSKSKDTIVLSFAQQMITDHSTAQRDLQTMGGVVGFTITDTSDAEHAATISKLDTLTGTNFDSTYIHQQVLHHKETIDFYTDELKNGQQINVRAYANSILQNIQIHYQRADSIATALY